MQGPLSSLLTDQLTPTPPNRTHSAFCVSPSFDIYNPKEAVFLFLFQFLKAEKLAILPNRTLTVNERGEYVTRCFTTFGAKSVTVTVNERVTSLLLVRVPN